VLVPEFLPESIKGKHVPQGDPPSDVDSPPGDLKQFIDERWSAGSCNLHGETVEMMERYLITRVLREAEGNQSQAAERLGITRGSLRHKIRSLGIVIEHVVQAGRIGPLEGE
jgi:two-component system nitrogen regulation response regulator GlnG